MVTVSNSKSEQATTSGLIQITYFCFILASKNFKRLQSWSGLETEGCAG
jgi:hypothetical protein